MKPFDLQKAIDNHPLCTRDGRDVIDYRHWELIKIFEVLIKNRDGSYELLSLPENGRVYNGENESRSDLFLKSKKKKKLFIAIKREKEINTHETSYAHEEKRTLDFPDKSWQIVEVEIDV